MTTRIPPKPSSPRPANVRHAPPPKAAAPTAPSVRTRFGDDFSRGRGRALRARASAVAGSQASSLSTERLNDGKENCLERAAELARPGDTVILLRDRRDGVGHALVRRADGTIVDPNFPKVSYQSLGQWQALNNSYTDPRPIPATSLSSVLNTPPGPEREALIARLGLQDAAGRRVADETTVTLTAGPLSVNTSGEVTHTVASTTQGVSGGGDVDLGPVSLGISAGTTVSSELEISFNPTQPLPNGTFAVTISSTSTAAAVVEGTVGLGAFGLAGGNSTGVSSQQEYQLNLTASQIAAFEAGALPLPSVADPLTLPIGGSLTMSTGSFHTSTGAISYGGLSLSSSSEQTNTHTLAVEHTGETTVRVTVGPTSTLAQNTSLGLEVGAVSASVGRDSTLSDSSVVSVEFDLATPEGAAAYEAFVATGQLPETTGPGVLSSYREETLGYEGGLAGQLELGDILTVEHQFWTEDMTWTRHTENGVTSLTATGHTVTGGEFEIAFSGEPATVQSFSLTLGSGETISVNGPEGLQQLQELALAQGQAVVLNRLRQTPELAGKTDAEIREYIAGQLPGSVWEQLLARPGDASFSSFSDWLTTYQAPWAVDPNWTMDPLAALPSLSNYLLQVDAQDTSAATALFQGLQGQGSVDDFFKPAFQGGADGHLPSFAELGLGSLSQVTLTPAG